MQINLFKDELSEKTEKGKLALKEKEKIFKSSCCNWVTIFDAVGKFDDALPRLHECLQF